MPIINNAKIETKVCYGTHLTIHTEVDTMVSSIPSNSEVHGLTVTKMAVGNKFIAVVCYETP
ncbi:MAG: hypothetical protein Tp1100DCM51572_27 [Prokaryotic dsDNA virus sp.]|nr:MAG: hypothetical protein Tp1100DCM51572_27 [Prokaryotic dsDNA virus sp.]